MEKNSDVYTYWASELGFELAALKGGKNSLIFDQKTETFQVFRNTNEALIRLPTGTCLEKLSQCEVFSAKSEPDLFKINETYYSYFLKGDTKLSTPHTNLKQLESNDFPRLKVLRSACSDQENKLGEIREDDPVIVGYVEDGKCLAAASFLYYDNVADIGVLVHPSARKRGLTHIEIEEDVRTGNLAYSLTKPASYLWSRYWRALGSVLSRFSILVFAGVFFAYIFSGGFPDEPGGLLLFVPLCLLSLAVGLIFHVVIGICSFWIQDSSPIYWVWQKMGFVLGGMILPLDIYPEWLRNIAMVTPFSALIYEPAKAAITMDVAMALGVVLKLILWGGVGVLIASFVFSKASRGLVLNGG